MFKKCEKCGNMKLWFTLKPLTVYIPLLRQKVTLLAKKLCMKCRKDVQKDLQTLKHG